MDNEQKQSESQNKKRAEKVVHEFLILFEGILSRANSPSISGTERPINDFIDKEHIREIVHEFAMLLGESFTKTNNRCISGTDRSVNDFTNMEFKRFIKHRLSELPEIQRDMVLDALKKVAENYKDEYLLSVRECMAITLNSMIKSNEFSNYHHMEVSKADTLDLLEPDDSMIIELNPAEILLLQYLNGRSTEPALPGYFTHDYHVDYATAIKKYSVGGYLKYADAVYTLNQLTVAQLKTILIDHNCSAIGKKQKLIASVEEVLTLEELSTYGRNFFRLTAKGQKLVDANAHIKYFHSMKAKLSISIDEANAYKQSHPGATNEEIAFAILNNRILENSLQSEWGLVRNDYYAKSVVCFHACMSLEELKFLLIVCYLDVELSRPIQERHPDFSIFASGIMSRINFIVKECNLQSDDLQILFEESVRQFYQEVPDYPIKYTFSVVLSVFQELLTNL